MDKAELSARVAARTSMSKPSADVAVSAMFSTIADALVSGETERIAGFGTFSTRSRTARQGRNPRTGESIAIAASNTPFFKAGKTLRDTLNTDRISDVAARRTASDSWCLHSDR